VKKIFYKVDRISNVNEALLNENEFQVTISAQKDIK
jgi:hypothetical protein